MPKSVHVRDLCPGDIVIDGYRHYRVKSSEYAKDVMIDGPEGTKAAMLVTFDDNSTVPLYPSRPVKIASPN